VEGFAAGTLLSAVCLLLVIAAQRAGRQRVDLRRLLLRRRLRAIRLPCTSRQRTSRTRPAQETVPPPAPAGAASVRMQLLRGGGRHAAPAGGSGRLAGRRRSRLLTTRD
jgi:hypothetical protein